MGENVLQNMRSLIGTAQQGAPVEQSAIVWQSSALMPPQPIGPAAHIALPLPPGPTLPQQELPPQSSGPSQAIAAPPHAVPAEMQVAVVPMPVISTQQTS